MVNKTPPGAIEPGGVYCLGYVNREWNILVAFTEKGNEVIIQTPVYFYFGVMLRDNDRKVIENPHNPVGRFWTRNELEKIGEFCIENNIKILSDDVYFGLVFPNQKYTPIAASENC